MERTDFGGGAERVALVLGYGNQSAHDGVRWLVDRLTEAGYRVTAFELPLRITDFEREYLAPVERFVAAHDPVRVLGHSTGGLVASHLDGDAVATRTYLSPWWGFHGSVPRWLLALVSAIPTSRAVVPTGIDGGDLGELASPARVADAPSFIPPTVLRAVRRAQRERPPFDEGDTVFYNPADPVVGTAAIEAAVPAGNRVPFEGGHELFNARSRSGNVESLLRAVDRGVDGLDG